MENLDLSNHWKKARVLVMEIGDKEIPVSHYLSIYLPLNVNISLFEAQVLMTAGFTLTI